MLLLFNSVHPFVCKRKKHFTETNDRKRDINNLHNNSKILFLFNSVHPFVCRTITAYIYDSMFN